MPSPRRLEKRYIDLKVARIVKPREPLEIRGIERPKPKGSQVQVQLAGVYHSDIHLWECGYEGLGGQFLKDTDRGVKYPLTPGHKIAGYIESLGDEASTALEGSLTDLIEFVSLMKREVIKLIISNLFKLDQATEALKMLKNGKILGRGVVNL